MYITVHDGFDTTNWSDIKGRSTKQWKLEHWIELVDLIHKERPGVTVIQLGAKTGRPIENVDQCLLNHTTLSQAFNILSKSTLHIDGDSGLVHAATALKVPCIVMFGPTPDYFYGYSQNVNLRSSFCSDACFWLKNDWMASCALGFETPKCMDEILPEHVFEHVKKALNKQGPLEDLNY